MNDKLSEILREISVLLEMKGIEFKPRAYEKVADTIANLSEDVGEMYKKGGLKAILEIPGVGEGIGKKIEEFITKGKVTEHQKLKKSIPVDIEGLSKIEGIGPKTILKLYKQFKIKNVKDLEQAIKDGKLEKGGIGEKTQKNILRGIDFLQSGGQRLILGFHMPKFRSILDRIKKVEGVKVAEFAGSVRRMQETIGDLDILVISAKPQKVTDFFVSMPEVESVLSHGPTRSSVRLNIGIDADLRVLPPESFGAAQQYFTGDKYHNVIVRQIAVEKGYKLNEYGLFKGKKTIAAEDEKEIYEKLGLEWMSPELRTNRGEIEAAKTGKLPKLIGYDELKGDLQVQTDWTDGENSIEEMAKTAQKMGLEYIAITDHTKSLAMTGGSDEKRLLSQMKEIDKINKKFSEEGSKFKILKSAEINIMKDGKLDIDDEVVAQLDVAGAAVHSLFKMSKKEMTERIITAMENQNVDIIFHPTGRIIGRRAAYELDMEEILKAAKRTKTVLEIDSFPDRLDLRDEYVKRAVEMGIKLSIDSDAHSINHYKYLEFGIAQARRGWAEKKDVINTKSWQEMLKCLK